MEERRLNLSPALATYQWLEAIGPSPHRAANRFIDAMPVAYVRTLAEIRGVFSTAELAEIVTTTGSGPAPRKLGSDLVTDLPVDSVVGTKIRALTAFQQICLHQWAITTGSAGVGALSRECAFLASPRGAKPDNEPCR
jgi:hypothetical protein